MNGLDTIIRQNGTTKEDIAGGSFRVIKLKALAPRPREITVAADKGYQWQACTNSGTEASEHKEDNAVIE